MRVAVGSLTLTEWATNEIVLSIVTPIRPLSGTSSFVKWHSAVHGFYVSETEWVSSTCLSVPTSWMPWITWKLKKTTLIFTAVASTISYKKNHRCQCKQMHGNYFRITTALCRLTAVYCRSGLAHTRTRPETSSTVRLRSQSVVTYLLYFTPPTVTVNFDLFESHASLSLSLGLFLVKIGPIFPRYRVKLTMCTTHQCRDGQTDGRTGGKHDVSGHTALGGCIKRPGHFSPRSAM